MYTANEILSKVNEYINSLTYDRKPQSLYEPIKYVLSLGGKRIRPTLMLLSYNLFKDDPETILSPACALETYHNYTLLHDDLMVLRFAADSRQFMCVGMPIRLSYRATQCLFWLSKEWLSATADTSVKCFVSSPLRHLRLERVNSTTWSLRIVMT